MSQHRFDHWVLAPSLVHFRKLSEVKVGKTGNPYYWFELEDSKYGFTASRTLWGKYGTDGQIIWDRIGPDEMRQILTSHSRKDVFSEAIRYTIVRPSDFADFVDQSQYLIPSAVIWFKDDSLLRDVRESKRPIESTKYSSEARHVNAINRDRPGPFEDPPYTKSA